MDDPNLGRHSGLSRNPGVLRDMNNVRRNLHRLNPGGYTAPIAVSVSNLRTRALDGDGDDFAEDDDDLEEGEIRAERPLPVRVKFYADLLPLYFASSVARGEMEDLPSRPRRDKVVFRINGAFPREAVQIFISYCHGSARAHNWAADLDAAPSLAAYVYDLAVEYKVQRLEQLVANSAFSEDTESLCEETAVRLLNRARDRSPALYHLAFLFICYNLRGVVKSDEWKDLGASDLRKIFVAKQLRADQETRFAAIVAWNQGATTDKDREMRQAMFYRLMRKILYVHARNPELLDYSSWADDAYTRLSQLPPVAVTDKLREGNTSLIAFRLTPEYLQKVKDATLPMWQAYPSPRFLGHFKAFGYYWSLELVWYHPRNVDEHNPGIGIFLRIIHGTEMAGESQEGEVVGVITDFMLRLHCSNDYCKAFKASRPLQFDMFNLPAGVDSIGDRHFVGYSDAKRLLRKNNDLHISVEIRRVREKTKPRMW